MLSPFSESSYRMAWIISLICLRQSCFIEVLTFCCYYGSVMFSKAKECWFEIFCLIFCFLLCMKAWFSSVWSCNTISPLICFIICFMFGFCVDKLRRQPSSSPDIVEMRNSRERHSTPEKRTIPHTRYSFHVGDTPSKLPMSKRQGKNKSTNKTYLCFAPLDNQLLFFCFRGYTSVADLKMGYFLIYDVKFAF